MDFVKNRFREQKHINMKRIIIALIMSVLIAVPAFAYPPEWKDAFISSGGTIEMKAPEEVTQIIGPALPTDGVYWRDKKLIEADSERILTHELAHYVYDNADWDSDSWSKFQIIVAYWEQTGLWDWYSVYYDSSEKYTEIFAYSAMWHYHDGWDCGDFFETLKVRGQK